MTVFRPKEEAPTKSGWYYGKFIGEPDIVPVPVSIIQGSLKTQTPFGYVWGISDYEWFGPVPEVRESGT